MAILRPLDRDGHSLLETLVVVGIILVLFSIALPHYSKAIRLAKEVAGNEAKRQTFLVQDIAKIQCGEIPGGYTEAEAARFCARRSYRRVVDAGKFELTITQLLYQVNTDAEFEAYWNTLISPDSNVPVTITQNGSLIAIGEDGAEYVLPPVKESIDGKGGEGQIVAWDFLSTQMAHMNSDFAGTTVLFADGSKARVNYPEPIPGTTISTRTIAILSNQFMNMFG